MKNSLHMYVDRNVIRIIYNILNFNLLLITYIILVSVYWNFDHGYFEYRNRMISSILKTI